MGTGRVLLVSWDGGGNLPPALALAARLVRAGHEVAVMADGSPPRPAVAAAVAASGATLVPYPSMEPWPAGVSFEDDPARFDEVRNGVATAQDSLAVAEEMHPDALVVDCMAGAGLVAAERLALPTAVLVHVLYQPFVAYWADLAVDVNRCRSALGMATLEAPVVLEQLRRLATVLALVPESFDYPGAPRTPTTHYVGPILDPTPPEPPADLGFAPADDRPLVLVSLSTTAQGQQRALPVILDALECLPARCLLTLGGVEVGDLRTPPNVVVHEWLPHRDVLPQVAAVIGHGGLSTVMAALAHGVPLVCVPQGREQPLNAERVAACGAGIALPMDAGAQEIADATSRVLSTPAFAQAAAAVKADIARHGAGEEAARRVQSLLGA